MKFILGLLTGLLISGVATLIDIHGKKLVSDETSTLTTHDVLMLMDRCHMTMDGVIHKGFRPGGEDEK